MASMKWLFSRNKICVFLKAFHITQATLQICSHVIFSGISNWVKAAQLQIMLFWHNQNVRNFLHVCNGNTANDKDVLLNWTESIYLPDLVVQWMISK